MIPLMKVHTPKGIGEKLQEVFDSGFLTEVNIQMSLKNNLVSTLEIH